MKSESGFSIAMASQPLKEKKYRKTIRRLMLRGRVSFSTSSLRTKFGLNQANVEWMGGLKNV